MAKKKTNQGDADDLRRRADDKVGKKYASMMKKPEALKGGDRLVYELRVHQIELEMQNEELRRARITLEETRDKYIDLYDFAPVGFFTFTREALIKEVNLTGASLLGIERQKLINARFRRFVVPADYEKWDRYLINEFVKMEKQCCDLELMREDKSLFYARIDSICISDKSGTPVVRTAISDITIQKKAEMALQQSSAEIEKSNKALQEALDKVRTLNNLLPICASCKKIRDDEGYWQRIETYISEHTDTVFSHGICPDCAKELYPDYIDKLAGREQKKD